jgi:hypothetical protein
MKILIFGLALLIPAITNAAGVPTSFTYQGKALNAAGTAPLTSTVSFTLSITDPSSACILYQETQTNVNLATTNGIFALQVGSLVGATKRVSGVDPGLSMTTVFANAGTQLVSSNGSCPGYTPASNDVRKLHVVITPSSGSAITVSPDLTINAVPNSLVAETLQGQTPVQLNPPGAVIGFATANCPSGYLAANGSSYTATTYPNLAMALISGSIYLYGGTVASGSFNVPNAQGVFLRGAGSQTNGKTYSTTVGTFQTDTTAVNGLHDTGHSHTDRWLVNGSGGVLGYSGISGTLGNGFLSGVSTANLSGDTETRPANLAVTYCIKY